MDVHDAPSLEGGRKPLDHCACPRHGQGPGQAEPAVGARPVGAGEHFFGGEVGHGDDAGLGDEAPPVPLAARDQPDRQVGTVAVVPDRV